MELKIENNTHEMEIH